VNPKRSDPDSGRRRDQRAAATAVTPYEPSALRWWGRFEIPEDHGGLWRVGPLELVVERRRHDWLVGWREEGENMDQRLEVLGPIPAGEMPELDRVERYASRQTTAEIVVTPLLADRAVVSRPDVPFHLLGGDEVDLFVSTPVWIRLEAGEPLQALTEIPITRPSDTWFGPSTRVGELCYASRTTARLHLENLPPRPHRAVTPVLLRNRARQELLLERLNLPVPNLTLYFDTAQGLWTQQVVVERQPDRTLAQVRLEEGPPERVGSAVEVSPPRQAGSRSVLRALGALLG
jgi:hypothetical protein